MSDSTVCHVHVGVGKLGLGYVLPSRRHEVDTIVVGRSVHELLAQKRRGFNVYRPHRGSGWASRPWTEELVLLDPRR
jgi:hypothetical protein